MSVQLDPDTLELVISGFEKGIASSAYTGISSIVNMNTQYYPGVAYVNYKRQAATLTGSTWFAGAHSTNVSDNSGWIFAAAATYGSTTQMGNPVQQAQSPAGLNYILDTNGYVWKQTSVNAPSWAKLEPGTGRLFSGNGGLAYWNNYIVVLGNGSIEFCGNGTNDSGIISSNWNLTNQNVAEVSVTYQTSPIAFTSSPISGATSATLASNWTGQTGAFPVTFPNSGADVRTVNFTNGSFAVTWSPGLGSNTSASSFEILQMSYTVQTSTYPYFYGGETVEFSGTIASPLVAGQSYILLTDVVVTEGTVFQLQAPTPGFLMFTSTGNPTFVMTDYGSPYPIQNTSISAGTITFNNPAGGSIQITLASSWLQPTGSYQITDPLGNSYPGIFTYGSTAVQLSSATFVQPTSGTYLVSILTPNLTSYRAYVSKVDGNLYFTNGAFVGSIFLVEATTNFNPGIPGTYNISYGFFALSSAGNQGNDSTVDLVDLSSTMVVAGTQSIYTWDYVSPYTSAPVPIDEPITRIRNLLNNIYISAGQKGNLYTSNGSYAQVLFKIPDQITQTIDPVWTFGDIMKHRGRIYFQAFAQNTSGTNILAGIFSLLVSPGVLGEVASGIVMEAQNSYGLVPVSGATSAGLLIDNIPSSNGQDSYYSVYSNGSGIGGIDYNNTTVWGNNEPYIETDIIPLGSVLDKRTIGQCYFKLDRPMVAGESISLYARASMSDTYVLLGTTSTNVLSDYQKTNIWEQQWIQLKVTFVGASSGPSFQPIKEIRIQTN